MSHLLIAIFCSTCLLVVFKLIQQFKLDKLPVIVVNYFTAAGLGAILTPGRISFGDFILQPWFPLAVMLGLFFIVIFYAVALSTETSGIAVTSVAFKISLVIPVAAAWFLYGDKMGFIKIAGILLALVSIVLTSRKDAADVPTSKAHRLAFLLPAIVFFGSGTCDALFNYMQEAYIDEDAVSDFLIILFLTAGAAGTAMLAYGLAKKKVRVSIKTLPMGMMLGIPNYGSAHFMMLALEKSGIEPSALWPLNNIGIILASTAVAAIFFRERINRAGATGIFIAVIAIALIALAEYTSYF